MESDGTNNRPRSSQKVVEVLTQDEIAALELVLNKGPHRAALLIYLMLYCGLRAGEAAAIRWEHLTMGDKVLDSVALTADITKTRTARKVPMNTATSDKVFKTYINANRGQDLPHPTDWVFPSPTLDRHISVRAIEKAVSKVGHYALGRHIRPHILRHTFGNELRKVTDIRTVQNLLGHASITSTMIYTHPNSDDSKKAIAAAFDKRTTDRGIVAK